MLSMCRTSFHAPLNEWHNNKRINANGSVFQIKLSFLFFVCSDGEMTEKLCPDGMVFNDYSPDQEKCDLPFNIDCSQRSKLRRCWVLPFWFCCYEWLLSCEDCDKAIVAY